MLLKRIDETITDGLFDLKDDPEELIEVCLVEPSILEKKVQWKIVEEDVVPRKLLHYDDTADGGNDLNRCWKDLYKNQVQLEDITLYSGTAIYFSSGTPNFGGVAKSGVYLRYSKGFHDWLATFDHFTAERLRTEVAAFESVIGADKNKKLPKNWYQFKNQDKGWPLIVLCRLSNGRLLVHWLAAENDDMVADEFLSKLNVDVQRSRELMHILKKPVSQIIVSEFQMASGIGRNAFGKELAKKKATKAEQLRLVGVVPQNASEKLRFLWRYKLEYKIALAPSPDTSSLLFLPEGALLYSELKNFIDGENEKQQHFNAKKKKRIAQDDSEHVLLKRPAMIPVAECATIFLTNMEKGQKSKRIMQEIFPSISLRYFSILNVELLNSKLEERTVAYMGAVSCGKRHYPSAYQYWTKIFTSALRRQEISAWEVYYNFQRFIKSYSCADLLKYSVINRYFELLGSLLRLQRVITFSLFELTTAEAENLFFAELEQIGKFEFIIPKGVFGIMKETMPSGKEIIGEAYDALNERLKEKFDNFARKVWCGVPPSEYPAVMRGALTGILLCELSRQLNKENRSFLVTQGRHPSSLRGRDLIQVFEHGMSLLTTLDKNPWFSRQLAPFILSVQQESNQNNFNMGLTFGIFYQNSKEQYEGAKND